MKEQRSAYDYLSKYRTELMGIAILWVMWYHSEVHLDFFGIGVVDAFFRFLKRLGYIGVDIFLILSGMGVYNSLQKNTIPVFLVHRLKRIAPIWYLGVLSSILILRTDFSIKELIGYVTFTRMWLTDNPPGNWYVYAIVFFYLLSPSFSSLLSTKSKKLYFSFMFLMWLIISFQFIGTYKIRVFVRILSYLIGMYQSADLKEKVLTPFAWARLILLFFAGMAWFCYLYLFHYDHLEPYGMYYPVVLAGLPLTLFLARAMDLCEIKLKLLNKIFSMCGNASLEILLLSGALFEMARMAEDSFWRKRIPSLGILVFSVVVGIILRNVIVYVLKNAGVLQKRIAK